jgi:hypothetical protein
VFDFPAQLANESLARDRGSSSRKPGLWYRLQARIAGPSLDARLAGGEQPWSDPVLASRASQLVTDRNRRRLVQGLERALAGPPDRVSFSSAVACNHQAVEVARPALEQLVQALYSRDQVQAQGIVLTHRLLTDPCSALYHPAELDELDEVARQALVALAPEPATPRPRERVGRSHRRSGRAQSAVRSRSLL